VLARGERKERLVLGKAGGGQSWGKLGVRYFNLERRKKLSIRAQRERKGRVNSEETGGESEWRKAKDQGKKNQTVTTSRA